MRQVNPNFSSVTGRVKFLERHGLSVHQSAASVLARRLLGCSECVPLRWVAPVDSTYKMPLTTSRRSTACGLPPGLAGGSNGNRISNYSQIRSLGYGLRFIQTA